MVDLVASARSDTYTKYAEGRRERSSARHISRHIADKIVLDNCVISSAYVNTVGSEGPRISVDDTLHIITLDDRSAARNLNAKNLRAAVRRNAGDRVSDNVVSGRSGPTAVPDAKWSVCTCP